MTITGVGMYSMTAEQGPYLRVRASAQEAPPTKARRNLVISRLQIHQLFTGSIDKKEEKTWEDNCLHATRPSIQMQKNMWKNTFQLISITAGWCPRSKLQVLAKSPGQKFGKLWPGYHTISCQWCTAEIIRGVNGWYVMKNPEMLSRKMTQSLGP